MPSGVDLCGDPVWKLLGVRAGKGRGGADHRWHEFAVLSSRSPRHNKAACGRAGERCCGFVPGGPGNAPRAGAGDAAPPAPPPLPCLPPAPGQPHGSCPARRALPGTGRTASPQAGSGSSAGTPPPHLKSFLAPPSQSPVGGGGILPAPSEPPAQGCGAECARRHGSPSPAPGGRAGGLGLHHSPTPAPALLPSLVGLGGPDPLPRGQRERGAGMAVGAVGKELRHPDPPRHAPAWPLRHRGGPDAVAGLET